MRSESLCCQYRKKDTFRRMIFYIPPNQHVFLEDVIVRFANKYPDVKVIVAVESPQEIDAIKNLSPAIADVASFILSADMYFLFPFRPQAFMTSEQYRPLPKHSPAIYCSHGQPAKGLTWEKSLIFDSDYIFSCGPFYTKVLKDFCDENFGGLPPHLKIREVGYPKSDKVIQGEWQREKVLTGIGLDPERKTLLYAPAFNEGASLREFGPQLVQILASIENCNVIIKLAVDHFVAANDQHINGGVNWFEALARFEALSHVYLSRERLVDPYLAAADVLVTDVSSVSFEFMVLGKPVVFVDTPRFFSHALKKYFPHEETEKWRNRSEVNAGREFGIVAETLKELPEAVRSALARGYRENFRDLMREKLLYNPGHAADVAADAIYDLLLQESRGGGMARVARYCRSITGQATLKVALKQRAPGLFLRLHALKDFISKRVAFNFINAKATVKAARRAGLPLNDYLESIEDTPRKKGHRDRIIASMEQRNLLTRGQSILEIGTGTGRFLEKCLDYKPLSYEVYETAGDWCFYLRRTYRGKGSPVVIHNADGSSLSQTPNGSVDLVHAHAVFVHLSSMLFFQYLKEMARVLKRDGAIVLDIFQDSDWSADVVSVYVNKGTLFPVITNRALLESVLGDMGLFIVDEFTEIFSNSFSRYLVIKRMGNRS